MSFIFLYLLLTPFNSLNRINAELFFSLQSTHVLMSNKPAPMSILNLQGMKHSSALTTRASMLNGHTAEGIWSDVSGEVYNRWQW